MFLVVSKLAFILWLRIDEALNLKWKHITLNVRTHVKNNYKHVVQIAERKTDKTNKVGNLYNLYLAPPEEIAACPFNALNRWFDFLKSRLKRDLHSEDYIFPSQAKNGLLDTTMRIQHPAFNAILKNVVKKCKFKDGMQYTLHCFRRGGAQHRHIYAKTR
jgi:integrase